MMLFIVLCTVLHGLPTRINHFNRLKLGLKLSGDLIVGWVGWRLIRLKLVRWVCLQCGGDYVGAG